MISSREDFLMTFIGCGQLDLQLSFDKERRKMIYALR